MKIGEVSAKFGMPASTIRYYEKVGLITEQRRVSGRREFDERALFTLEFIRLCQAAGFTLDETKSLLEAFLNNAEPKNIWRKKAQNKRRAIQTQIRELKQMDQILSEFLSCKCPSLSVCVKKGMAEHAGS